MAIDEIVKDISDNIYAITIILGAVGFMAKIILSKNKTVIENAVSDAKDEICNNIKSLKENVDRHEHWFDEFFSSYIKSSKDVKYRESVKNSDDENEYS